MAVPDLASGDGGTYVPTDLLARFLFDDGGVTSEDFANVLDWDYALESTTVTTGVITQRYSICPIMTKMISRIGGKEMLAGG